MTFPDTAGHWAETDIDQAVTAGAFEGFPDGTFRPDEPMTRAQMTRVLNNLGLLETSAPPEVVPEDPPSADPPVDSAPQPDLVSPVDDRLVILAWADTALDQSDVIYDFEGRGAVDVTITAVANTTVRNIGGPGSRRVGDRDGVARSNIGFEDCEGTFFHMQHDGGATLVDPFFVRCHDVNPQPNVDDGDVMQCFAYQGDIVRPLFGGCKAFGKQRPQGSGAHNDALQFTGIEGGRVIDPIVRDCLVEGASSAAIQAKHVHGLFTIEGCILSERFGAYHAVIAKPGDPTAQVLWRNNVLKDGASAALTGGWGRHPDTVDQPGLTIT